MLKKFILSLLILFGASAGVYGRYCSLCHVEEDCCFCPDCDVDFYIGFAGGIGILAGNYRAVQHLTDDSFFHANSGTSSLIGGVVGAQTYVCRKVFAALQANVLYNTLGKQDIGDIDEDGIIDGRFSLENFCQFGVDARVGRLFPRIAIFALFGFEAGHWKFHLNNDSAAFFHGIPPGDDIIEDKCLCGPRVGAGATFPLTRCIWLNVEYAYTWFGVISRRLNDPITGRWHHTEKVRQQSVLGGINLLF